MRSSLDQHVRPGTLGSRGYAARCVAHRRQANPRFSVLRTSARHACPFDDRLKGQDR